MLVIMTSIPSTVDTDYRCPGATCLYSYDDSTPLSDNVIIASRIDPNEPSGEGPVPTRDRDSLDLQQLNAAPESNLPTSNGKPSDSVDTPN